MSNVKSGDNKPLPRPVVLKYFWPGAKRNGSENSEGQMPKYSFWSWTSDPCQTSDLSQTCGSQAPVWETLA
jgi:hypothetical protein